MRGTQRKAIVPSKGRIHSVRLLSLAVVGDSNPEPVS
jgi:hypothetical protein